MPRYAVKFAKGHPIVVDEHGKTVAGAVVRRLNFPAGPVDYVAGRRFPPDHRPRSVDIEIGGVPLTAVPVKSSQAS